MQGAPAVKDGVAVFGAWDTNLYALDAETLELRWKWNNGKSQVLFSPGNVRPGHRQRPGRHRRAGPVHDRARPQNRQAALARQHAQVPRSARRQRRRRHRLRQNHGRGARRVRTGKPEYTEKWLCDLGFGYDHAPCPVLEADGVVYAGSRNGVIAAIDAATGKLLWRYRGGDSAVNDFTKGPDGSVYATLIEGRIYRISGKTP